MTQLLSTSLIFPLVSITPGTAGKRIVSGRRGREMGDMRDRKGGGEGKGRGMEEVT